MLSIPIKEEFKLRCYQEDAVSLSIDKLINSNKIPVLCMCPNSGKTITAIATANELIEKHGYKKIVFTCEGMDILRKQTYREFEKFSNHKVYRLTSQRDINSKECLEADIIITLPQTLDTKKKLLFDIDLLIVDEAHNRYESRRDNSNNIKQLQRIIKTNNIKKQLLLTGTPAIFILKNGTDKKPMYDLITYTMTDLYSISKKLGESWFCKDLKFYCVASNIDRGDLRNFFSEDGDVSKSYNISNGNKERLLDESLGLMITWLNDAMLIDNPTLSNYKGKKWFKTIQAEIKKGWSGFMGGVGKTMFACHNQKLANYVYNKLNELGIKTVLSCEDAKDDSENIKLFQEDPSIKCLVVVNRAILGFNMPELENIVDLSGTRNLNRIYQLYARVTRYSDIVKKKRFFKVGFEKEDEITKMVMDTAVSLCSDNIKKFNLRNKLDLPVIRKIKKTYKKKVGKESIKSSILNFPSYENLDILELFHGIEHNGDYNISCEIIAESTSREILESYGQRLEANIEKNKERIIDWIINNKKIPSKRSEDLRERRMYGLLNSYIYSASNNYDKDFEDKYRKLLKELNITQALNNADNLKKDIIDWITNNKKIPLNNKNDFYEKKLCSGLRRYTYKTSVSYDEKFENKYRKLLKELNIEEYSIQTLLTRGKKEKIIDWTVKNRETPKAHSKDSEEKKLALSLCHYMNINDKGYDKKFKNKYLNLLKKLDIKSRYRK